MGCGGGRQAGERGCPVVDCYVPYCCCVSSPPTCSLPGGPGCALSMYCMCTRWLGRFGLTLTKDYLRAAQYSQQYRYSTVQYRRRWESEHEANKIK